MKFPIHTDKSTDELLNLSDEQLGKELRLMLENIKNGYQATRTAVPYSMAGTYNLALLAIQQEDFDEFGFLV